MSNELPKIHFSSENSNVYKSFDYLEKDYCPYTENNANDTFCYKGENEDDSETFKSIQCDNDIVGYDDQGRYYSDGNLDIFNIQPIQPVTTQNLTKKIIIQENNCTNLGQTKATSLFLGQKREKPFDEQKIETHTILSNCDKKTKKKSNQGRKIKNSDEKGKHNKLSEDNMIRKIKSNYSKFSHNKINDNFIDKNLQFLKLDSKIGENLKKDYNEELMHKKFRELYETSLISTKYRKQKTVNKDLNRIILKKIFSEKKEYDVINLLNLTYIELFEEFRTNYLDTFLKEIKMTLVKDGESSDFIEKYIENMKNLCINFENWFSSKNGRKRVKKNKSDLYN